MLGIFPVHVNPRTVPHLARHEALGCPVGAELEGGGLVVLEVIQAGIPTQNLGGAEGRDSDTGATMIGRGNVVCTNDFVSHYVILNIMKMDAQANRNQALRLDNDRWPIVPKDFSKFL